MFPRSVERNKRCKINTFIFFRINKESEALMSYLNILEELSRKKSSVGSKDKTEIDIWKLLINIWRCSKVKGRALGC